MRGGGVTQNLSGPCDGCGSRGSPLKDVEDVLPGFHTVCTSFSLVFFFGLKFSMISSIFLLHPTERTPHSPPTSMSIACSFPPRPVPPHFLVKLFIDAWDPS